MAFIWEDLSTEQPNSQHVDLDLYDSQTILALMNEEDQSVPRAIGLILPDIARAVDVIVPRLQSGGRLIYIGAGTSGRLGVLDAVECPPTYSVSPSLIQGIIAGGNESMFIATEGAEDDEAGAASDLKSRHLTHLDVVMGISASGRTPYVIGAIRYAKACGALTVTLSCNRHSVLSTQSDIAIEVDTGSEVVLGSTRLKAGTAQKMILNMISTASMIKLGKVYRNLMVDLKVSNHKLRERAKRIVMMVTGLEYDAASSLLDSAGGSVKLAIVMWESGVDRAEAERRLNAANGFVRDVVSNNRPPDGTSSS